MPHISTLREQKESKLKGNIYHCTQIDITYSSNHIEGSRLSYDQTRYIFETNTIGIEGKCIRVDDILDLRDICLTAQDNNKRLLDYFKIFC